jgi:hypothetical protein
MFLAVTAAPGTTAPEGSFTVPRIVAVGNWAKTGTAKQKKTSTAVPVIKHFILKGSF